MTEEQQYVRGFNHGYKLAKYLPDFLAKIVTGIQPKNDYMTGFFSGKEEWELEHNKEQLQELKKLRDQSKDQERGIEK